MVGLASVPSGESELIIHIDTPIGTKYRIESWVFLDSDRK